MAQTTKVSDCHHKGYTIKKVDHTQEKDEATGEYKDVWIEVCDICHQPCKVVELLVEEK